MVCVIKPGLPGLGVWSLSHWTTRRVPMSPSLFYFYNFIYSLIFGCAGSLVAASIATLLLLCVGFSLPWLLLLQSTGFVLSAPVSVVVTCELNSRDSWALEPRLDSCGTWAGLIHCMWNLPGLDRGSNLCLLHWQGNSFPLSHQETLSPFLKQR